MSNRYLHKHKWIAVLLCLCFMMTFILPGYAADGEVGGGDATVSDGGSASDGIGDSSSTGDTGSGDTGSGSGESSGDVTGGGTDITEPPVTEGGDGSGETPTEPTNPDNGEGTIPPTEGETTPPEGTEVLPPNPEEPGAGEPLPPTGEEEQPVDENKVVCDICGAAEGEHHVNSACEYYPHLVGCDGEGCAIEGCACPCHQPSKLYERLMLCETYVAMDVELQNAEIWEYPLMSDDEKAAVQAKLAELKALDKHDVEGCTDECTGEDCACKCHNKFEHIDGCDGVNCTVEGCQCSCHSMSLFDRLMITTRMSEYDGVLNTASEEELAALDALTEEQRVNLNLHYMELLSLPIEAVSFTEAAPLVEMPVVAPIPPMMMLPSFGAPDAGEDIFKDQAGLESSKTVTPVGDGQYKIRLEAYTTGRVYDEIESMPCDIVILVDASQKLMDATMADKQNVGVVLNDAVKTFVDGLEETHRVAFATFASGKSGSSSGWYNLATEKEAAKQYISDNIPTTGQSAQSKPLHGFDQATELFKQSTGNQKVVVLISAGCPISDGSGKNGFDTPFADEALTASKIMKAAGTTVYSVGIFDGADAANLPIADSSNENKYMHYISGNYPDAASMTNPGTGSMENGSYFLSADDAEDLAGAFDSLIHQIGSPSVSLGTETKIVDSITDQFEMPAGATVKIYKQAYDGKDFSGSIEELTEADGVKPIIDGNTVTVSGFDFDANFISEDPRGENKDFYGNKLIIEFTVAQKEGFLGGNNVKTNGKDSGIYTIDEETQQESKIEDFVRPEFNIPIPDVTVTAQPKNVYLLGSVTGAQLKEGATATIGGITLNFAAENYGLEAWQYEYVDISGLIVKDANGNVVGDVASLNSLENDQEYSVELTVSPKTSGEGANGEPVSAKTDKAEAAINVFTPEVTYKDNTVYYGAAVPSHTDLESNRVKEEWQHGDTLDTAVAMIGNKPTISYSYNLPNAAVSNGVINTKKDIPVTVIPTIDMTNITEYTGFLHNSCADKTCTVPAGAQFLLHPQTCQLKVTKSGGADDDTYIFHITKNTIPQIDMTVAVEGNGCATIYELPVGTYSITEEGNWSWRFNGRGSTITLNSVDLQEVVCVNTSNGKDQWLNDYSPIVKNHKAADTNYSKGTLPVTPEAVYPINPTAIITPVEGDELNA